MTNVNGQLRLTPTLNVSLKQNLGDFETLVEGLEYAARGDTGLNFYSSRGVLEYVVPFRDLRKRAIVTGCRLIRSGLKRGDRVGVIAETLPEFFEVFFGCQYAGLIPCPLPYSLHMGGRDPYVARLTGMMNAARMSAVIARQPFIGDVGRAAAVAGVTLVLTHDDLASVSSSNVDLTPHGKDDLAYIQYSSGSTSAPKGILITQKAITANARSIMLHGLKMGCDRTFSWLPLYHDMGLVGFCLVPVLSQTSVDYLATSAFARRPALWLKLMSENRTTISYAPSFGYSLVARRINGEAAGLDLSNWRAAGIGGDMVRADVLEEFSNRLKIAGFDAKAFVPSYGMAESTLAISFATLDREITVDHVDMEKMKHSQKAVPVSECEKRSAPDKVRSFVACGKALAGHEIEVRDGQGTVLGDREVGHVMIKGPSLMAGYYMNDVATDAIMGDDGFMDTGDMGYLLDGQIVLTGRAKDMILHNGCNIWPQDIEWALERIDALRGGDVAAFAIEDSDGADKVVVLVQCRLSNDDEREVLRREAAALVHQQAGVACDVVLVAPRSLPFTSSGKLSRAGARDRFLSGEITEIAVPLRAANDYRPVQEMHHSA